MRRVAVLFESSFCNCLAKGLLLVSILLLPFSSKAELTGKNWYGADAFVIESQNSCNSVYSITVTPQNDGQLQLFKDGKDVNSSNTVFASDIPSTISWQSGSAGDNAVKFGNAGGLNMCSISLKVQIKILSHILSLVTICLALAVLATSS